MAASENSALRGSDVHPSGSSSRTVPATPRLLIAANLYAVP